MFDSLFGTDDDEEYNTPTLTSGNSKRRGDGPSNVVDERPVDKPFIGLVNQGATCYLNSLLQALFFTPEFREAIYSINEDELFLDPPPSNDQTDSHQQSSDTTPSNLTVSSNQQSSFIDTLSNKDLEQHELLLSMGFETTMIELALKKWPSSADPNADRKMDILLSGDISSLLPNDSTTSHGCYSNSSANPGAVDDEEDSFLNSFMDSDAEPAVVTSISHEQNHSDVSKHNPSGNSTVTSQSNEEGAISSSNTSKSVLDQQSGVNNAENSGNGPKRRVREVIKALQNLFATMQSGDVASATTLELTQSFNWKSSHTSVQHDVHELSRVLMDVIERSMKGTKKQNLIRTLFHGTQCHQVKCMKCGTIKQRSESFGDLTIPIPRKDGFESSRSDTTLEHCLGHYFGVETLDGKNQYECDVCMTKTDAELGMKLVHLPPVLCLSLARMEYDYSTGNRVKNTCKVSFPPTLDLTGFLSETVSSSLKEPDSLTLDKVNNPLDNANNPLSSSSLTPIYDLYAIIIHNGASASAGHYHAYVKDLYFLSSSTPSNSISTTDNNDEETEEIVQNSKPGKKGKQNHQPQQSKKAINKQMAQQWAKEEAEKESERISSFFSCIGSDSTDSSSYRSFNTSSSHSQGLWFDFDDVRVSKIESSKIPSVFASNECAYMFFYKQRTHSTQLLQTSSLKESISNLWDLNLPKHLVSHIAQLNASLTTQRIDYDNAINRIEVTINWPHQFVINEQAHIMKKFISSSNDGDSKPKLLGGPPSIRWIDEQVDSGKLVKPSSDINDFDPPSSTVIAIDQRQPLSILLKQLGPLYEIYDSWLQMEREKSAEKFEVAPSPFFHLELIRNNHGNVLFERSFIVDVETCELCPGQGEKLTSSISIKDLRFAKNQQVTLWNGTCFAARLAVENTAQTSERKFVLDKLLLHPLPFRDFFSKWSSVLIRVYHPSHDNNIKEGDEEPLIQLSSIATSLSSHPLDQTFYGTIILNRHLVPIPFRTREEVMSELKITLPSGFPLSKLDLLLSSSALFNLLTYYPGEDLNKTFSAKQVKFLQPFCRAPSLESSSMSIGHLEYMLERVKTLIRDQTTSGDAEKSTNEDFEPLLLDPLTSIMLSSGLPIPNRTWSTSDPIDVSLKNEMEHATNEFLGIEAVVDDSPTSVDAKESSTDTTSQSTQEKPKKVRMVDVYFIIGFRLPKSSFNFVSSNSPSGSNINNRLSIKTPLPDDDSEKSKSSSATSIADSLPYHPRYLIKSIKENMTLREMVVMVGEEIGLPKPPTLNPFFQLYSVDAFDQKDRLYDNMSVTVKNATIGPYTTLWLEEGDEPKPGQLSLSVFLFRLNNDSSHKSSNTHLHTANEQNASAMSSLIQPMKTTRPNLLFIPFSLEMALQPYSAPIVSEVTDTKNEQGMLLPPPPPPPLPPKSTHLPIQTTLTSTLGSLKDEIIDNMFGIVSTSKSSPIPVESPSSKASKLPFDIFSVQPSSRSSILVWIDGQLMLGDDLELKHWKLNSWNRCNLAVLLLQQHPIMNPSIPESIQLYDHALECGVLRESNGVWKLDSNSEDFSLASPPSTSSILLFTRRRVLIHQHDTNSSDAIRQRAQVWSYGPLFAFWFDPSIASSSNPKGKGKGRSKEQEKPNNQVSQSHQNVLFDLDNLVSVFSSSILPPPIDSPLIPSESLLLAKIGLHPYSHDLNLPKWQLIFKPSLYVHQQVPSPSDKQDGSTKTNNTIEFNQSTTSNKHDVLMKHLVDPKIPGSSNHPDTTSSSSSAGSGSSQPKRKVKLSHGDVIVFSDSREWSSNHDDLYWDNQRKIGSDGRQTEEEYLSDLERAMIESTMSRRRPQEVALTIDVDI